MLSFATQQPARRGRPRKYTGGRYCRAAEQKVSMPTLFDLEAAPEDFAVAPETITTAQAGDFGARLGIQDSLKEEALRRAPREKAEL